jgi:hypothetical protein
MTYDGPEESGTVFDLQYSVVGELNRSYLTFDAFCGVVPDDLTLNTSDVFQGGTVEGNLCWSVPSGEVESLVMSVSPLFPEERVFFSLERE